MDNRVEQATNMARILYALHGAAFFLSLGTLSIIPLIMNYVKRPDSQGTFVYSHHSWMIRACWWYVLWFVIAWVLAVTVIGLVLAIPIWFVAWIWFAYRLIRGFIDLNNQRAME